MKHDRQRTAIAEACGWHSDGKGNWPSFGYPKGKGYPAEPELLPDYLNDLNAMHEAESDQLNRLGWQFQCAYTLEIRDVVLRRRKDSNPTQADLWMLHATAAQRAEAFLRTIGKWEEEP